MKREKWLKEESFLMPAVKLIYPAQKIHTIRMESKKEVSDLKFLSDTWFVTPE